MRKNLQRIFLSLDGNYDGKKRNETYYNRYGFNCNYIFNSNAFRIFSFGYKYISIRIPNFGAFDIPFEVISKKIKNSNSSPGLTVPP